MLPSEQNYLLPARRGLLCDTAECSDRYVPYAFSDVMGRVKCRNAFKPFATFHFTDTVALGNGPSPLPH